MIQRIPLSRDTLLPERTLPKLLCSLCMLKHHYQANTYSMDLFKDFLCDIKYLKNLAWFTMVNYLSVILLCLTKLLQCWYPVLLRMIGLSHGGNAR